MPERRPEAISRTLGNSWRLRSEKSEQIMYNAGSWRPREESFKEKCFVSSPTYKEFKSHHSTLTTRKELNKLK